MNVKYLLAILLVPVMGAFASGQTVTKIVPDVKIHKFEARDRQFWIDGDPTLLVAGEMHFGRVQPEDWDTRIKQAKAMGLNTISFYLFWNMCEPKEGQFNFTGMTDVRRVIQLCQANGMWAVLRPGPYCCAEVEYGGIPWWTAKYPDVKIRSSDPKWLEWSKRYIEQVYKQVADLQVTRGGPLLMVQMDNEYGMIAGGNNSYLTELQKIFTGVGFDVQLFTCDPGGPGGEGALPGVLHGANGYQGNRGAGARGLARGGATQPAAVPAVEYPIFVPELYTNWFTGWSQPLATRYQTIQSVTNWTSNLIDQNCSFCYYVFFGGTTYGFYNGCNEYLPVVTSYDYGAPIDEAGRITEKYKALRELLSTKLSITPPEPPADPLVIEIPAIKLSQHETLLETLPARPTLVAAKPASMENLDQDYGFVLYRKKFDGGIKGTLELKKAMDYTVVMVNGKAVGKSFIGYGADSNKIQLPETGGPATLDILVYNLGRISVITAPRTQDRARKGLIEGASLDGKDLADWEMYSLPYEKGTELKPTGSPHTGPTFYRGTFSLSTLGGSIPRHAQLGHGAGPVNGHNLGRFWDRGGLRSLFVPSQWLKQGQNEIVILELHDAPKAAEVSGGTKIIEEQAVPFALKLDQTVPGPFPAPRAGRAAGGAPGAAPASQPANWICLWRGTEGNIAHPGDAHMADTPPTNKRPIGERRLAAIMFTDVVSFSARVQANESLTLRLVKRDFDAITQACNSAGGNVLKTTGDGLLMSFPTAGAAVDCALRVQKMLAHAAKTMPPEQVLEHRIGIHLGDVFITDQDVMGNDVNIAARVLSEAGGGEICVSQTVYDVVKHRLSVKGIYLGERELKNISEPVSIFRLPLLDDGSVGVPRPHRGDKSRKPILIGIVAALCLAAGALATWAVMNSLKQLASTQPSTQPVAEKSGAPAKTTATARFVAVDQTGGGNWKGRYGKLAAVIIGDEPEVMPGRPFKIPLESGAGSAEIQFTTAMKSTPPAPAVLPAGAPVRVHREGRVIGAMAGTPQGNLKFTINFPDTKWRRVTVYFWFYGDTNRRQMVDVRDARTNELLVSRAMIITGEGRYGSFDVSGNIAIELSTPRGSPLLSALFIDPAQ